MNDVALTAIQTAAFMLAGGLSLRYLAREEASIARAFLAAGLAAGGAMHVVMLIERGPLASADQPLAFNVFWASLALADPLGALLLNVRPRAGIALTLAIMIADVSINLLASAHLGLFSLASWRLWGQVGYALLAMVVAPRIWAATVGRPRGAARVGSAPRLPTWVRLHRDVGNRVKFAIRQRRGLSMGGALG